MPSLSDVDLSLALSKKEEARRLEAAQERLLTLRLALGGQLSGGVDLGPPVCVVFEGWDASGKGGCIKRLVAPLDPRHVRVAQFAAPTFDEKRHHFLWRVSHRRRGGGGAAGSRPRGCRQGVRERVGGKGPPGGRGPAGR